MKVSPTGLAALLLLVFFIFGQAGIIFVIMLPEVSVWFFPSFFPKKLLQEIGVHIALFT